MFVGEQTHEQKQRGVHSLWPALGLAVMYVERAVCAAQGDGWGELDAIRGLFISDETAVSLLQRSFGSAGWATSDVDEWDRAIAQYRDHLTQSAPPANQLDLLVERFELNSIERDMLLLALLPEIDLRFEHLFGYLQDDLTQKRPSIDLILNLIAPDFCEKLALWPLLMANGRLRHHQLLFCTPPASQPDAAHAQWTVRPAPHLVNFLLKLPTIDAQLEAVVKQPLATACPPHFQKIQQQIQVALSATHTPAMFILSGQTGIGRQATVLALAEGIDQPILMVDTVALLQGEKPMDSLRLVLRDGRLQQAMLYFYEWQTAVAHPSFNKLWQAILSYPNAVFLALPVPWQPSHRVRHRPIYPISFDPLDRTMRLQLWQRQLHAYPDLKEVLPFLSAQFQFTPHQIQSVVATAVDLANWQGTTLTKNHLLHACRQHSNQKLNKLATKIAPRYQWQDIVLAPDTLAQLIEIVQRLKHQATVFDSWGFGQKMAYGKGLAALFLGESGTGKTMSADIIAGELGLDLYKINLASVVSKYIGETEKNLERIFTEAETSNAILFFDEADALFGKRGDVKDSHDRYANLEVSYLLQRLEQFEGFVILASNLHANIDDAFVRRLAAIIEFPSPDRAEREMIWQVSLPDSAPVAEDVSFSTLANFKLTGGNIRNITLRAAFLAASKGKPISMQTLLHATKREFQKLGRLFDEAMFDEVLA